MPTAGNRPRLRALSLGEILDTAIKICLAQWRTLLRAVLVVVVPVQIVTAIVNADYTLSSFEFDASSTRSAENSLDELNQYLGGLAISTLLQLCAIGLATAACFRAIAQAYLGEPIDWRTSLSYALERWRPLLALVLLYVLGVWLGTVLFIAPGVWLFVAWAAAMPVLLAEGLRPRQALDRTFALVKGRWWRTFGTLVIGFILAGIISALMQGVFVIALTGTDDDTLVIVLSSLAGIVGMAVSTPLQAAILTVLYFDLRVRNEGFDRAQLARELGADEPLEPLEEEDEQDAEVTLPAGAPAAPAAPLWPSPGSSDADGDGPKLPPPPGWKPASDDDPPRLPGVPSG